MPDYVTAEEVRGASDRGQHADKFGAGIYSIEPGAPANQNIQRMLASDGMKTWKLAESREQSMLSEVERAVRGKRWIASLAWEPHPMNEHFRLT